MIVSMICGAALPVYQPLWSEKAGGRLPEWFANLELILAI
jgi:hypothetical protein